MDQTLFVFHDLTITGWKIIGYLGVLFFSARWILQLYSSRKAGRPVISRSFWLVSLTGSVLLLSYFVFGKNDSVGILSNMFPAFVALYNLSLDIRYHRRNNQTANEQQTGTADA